METFKTSLRISTVVCHSIEKKIRNAIKNVDNLGIIECAFCFLDLELRVGYTAQALYLVCIGSTSILASLCQRLWEEEGCGASLTAQSRTAQLSRSTVVTRQLPLHLIAARQLWVALRDHSWNKGGCFVPLPYHRREGAHQHIGANCAGSTQPHCIDAVHSIGWHCGSSPSHLD